MNYILRSPFERKRLNILYFPNKVLPSSYTIAQYGSFNRTKYSSWVNNFNNSTNNSISINKEQINIIEIQEIKVTLLLPPL